MSTPFRPLDRKKNFEKVVALLKQKVFSGQFRPGDRLPPERALAEALRVSRLSVREAYRALQVLGMLETRRGSEGGSFIRAPGNRSIIQSVGDLFRLQGLTLEEWTEARLLFELDIARLAIVRAENDDLARLEGQIKEAKRQIRAGTPAHAENIRFHLVFAELARNPILYTAYRSMMDLLLNSLTAMSASLEHARHAASAHMQIVATLKERNPDRLFHAVEEHVLGASKRLMAIAKKSPLFESNVPRGALFLAQKEE